MPISLCDNKRDSLTGNKPDILHPDIVIVRNLNKEDTEAHRAGLEALLRIR
jgi:hypothetical protein